MNIKLGTVTPILRIFDIVKARSFYLDYLGFRVSFEHRFDPGAPLYLGIVRDICELHLSEHHGDATPGSANRIAITGIEDFHGELHSKRYPYMRPRIETPPWGTKEVSVIDPFGNRLTFFEPKPE